MGQKVELNKENTAVLLYNKRECKWVDGTMSISTMFTAYYYGNFTGYNIYFNRTSKYFFYKKDCVQFLNKVENVSIEKQDVYVDGAIVKAFKLELFEREYYRVHVENGTIFTRNVTLKSNKHKNILKYYTLLADYAERIAEEKCPLYFLSQNYKRITPSNDVVLFNYIKGACTPVFDNELLLVPFDFNQSQIRAIDAALKNNISIIEGPPGTGKTQTILNLIANIIYRGKNCAVVSNNNTAIDNVFEKLSEEKLSFVAATLGRQINVERFFESDRDEELTHFLERNEESIKSNTSLRIADFQRQMKKIQDMEVETSILESQLIDLQNEQRHYDNIADNSLIINQQLSSTDYMQLITRLETPKKLWILERWLLGRKFKVKIVAQDINVLLSNAEKLYYQTKIYALTSKIESNRKFLEKHNKEQVAKKLKSLCRIFLEKCIRTHYQNHSKKEFSKESYKRDYDNFLFRYPVVLSTSQSLLNNAPRGFTFDYLIMDEASQGDLLSSILAMSCAKNLVVVGDSRQLQQIDEERLFQESEKLSKEYDIPKPYRYESNSILKSVKDAVPGAPTTLLREHYRCASDIINFCNRMFYNGELVPMTSNSGRHIEVIKTVPGNHARKNPNGSGLYNQREIDEIENILQASESDSIGIISPFRYQADCITRKYATDRIEADTIHKFQGRQKEEVILSFVVNALDKDRGNVENRLYDFVTNKELLNVAISRGRKKVTAIVADKVFRSSNNAINDFIKYAEYLYGSDVTKESSVTSVFDLLYSEYTNTLLSKYKGRPKKHKTELLMCDIIRQVLEHYGYIGYSMHTRLGKLVTVPDSFTDEERSYILHPWSHVDFLFYNKISKEKLFVLEVDGIRYHEQDKKQAEHDDIKDRVLQANDIPIFRFKTNESNEIGRLREIVKDFTH
ncbi:AAA family ATPase [bacterium]|nr:AAA family ATPase [candidate division CSSED10-310 bacterium]